MARLREGEMAIKPVLVEIIVAADEEDAVMEIAIELEEETGLVLDHDYLPVRLGRRRYEGMAPDDCVYIIRGEIGEGSIPRLLATENVGYVWLDEPVQAFDEGNDRPPFAP